MATYVAYKDSPNDIGLSRLGHIYWHDGHIDTQGQHYEEGPRGGDSRNYIGAGPLARMTDIQKKRADRAVFIMRENRSGRCYTLTDDDELVQL